MDIRSLLKPSMAKLLLFSFLCSIFLLVIPVPCFEWHADSNFFSSCGIYSHVRGFPLNYFGGAEYGNAENITFVEFSWIGFIANLIFWYIVSCPIIYFSKSEIAQRGMIAVKILFSIAVVFALANAVYIFLMSGYFINTKEF
jgi:hypothetical protein